MNFKTYYLKESNKPTCKTYSNGTKKWWLNGKLHREDGPAIEYTNGYKSWYLNGKRHREDGPAVEWPNGYKAWFLNSELHREDGPAIERANGTKEWWLNNVKYSKLDHKRELIRRGILKNPSLEDVMDAI